MILNITNGDYTISTDKDKLDIPFIHSFLSKEAYWSLNIPLDTVERAIAGSLCFGVYHTPQTGQPTEGRSQVGFARIITDYATIAYLGDVFITTPHRGRGLSKILMQQIMTHPNLQGLRRWVLLTADAHELYLKFGWKPIPHPEKYMEVHDPNVYKK
ncbi:GNAT family N-acetyltransferase [Puia sp. P3]|uniref:GNAT family N-acetyltransferase n=1 Tax=Puia sp. P3 TaxID=3423952 RepID=UPI003D668336